MHIIQTNIIKALYYKPKLRYSQIRPDGVESNLFQYHLKRLMKDDFVKKEDEFYQLTTKGKTYVDKLSTKTFKTREQAKIITLISIQNDKGEHAVYVRKHQPYYGYYAHPTGKVHFGESIFNAATREAEEKLGLTTDLKHVGECYVTISDTDGIITSVLTHCFKGKVAGRPDLNSVPTRKGTRIWAKLDEIDEYPFMPGYFEVQDLIDNSKEHFFKEFYHTI